MSDSLAPLREAPLPVVLMLLPHGQAVPPEWHALARVFAGLLTLAAVEAHKVGGSEACVAGARLRGRRSRRRASFVAPEARTRVLEPGKTPRCEVGGGAADSRARCAACACATGAGTGGAAVQPHRAGGGGGSAQAPRLSSAGARRLQAGGAAVGAGRPQALAAGHVAHARRGLHGRRLRFCCCLGCQHPPELVASRGSRSFSAFFTSFLAIAQFSH